MIPGERERERCASISSEDFRNIRYVPTEEVLTVRLSRDGSSSSLECCPGGATC